mmetsp:Transcript_16058/g.34875  ORF Transcript_16058/g.34875 Transcript_16058/m.34875 type:complete len:86 (+) Transcript_16058:195-452(+)
MHDAPSHVLAAPTALSAGVRVAVGRRCPPYAMPSAVLSHPHLPRLPTSAKVDRVSLQSLVVPTVMGEVPTLGVEGEVLTSPLSSG